MNRKVTGKINQKEKESVKEEKPPVFIGKGAVIQKDQWKFCLVFRD
jgi:hypothetical protein